MKMALAVNRAFRRFVPQDHGGLAVMAAFAAVPALIIAGGAIDLGIAYMARSQLVAAADAAALAGASAFYQDSREQVALDYFDANYPAAYLGSSVASRAATFDDLTGDVTVTAAISVPTSLLTIANIPSIDFNTSVNARASIGTVEVAMVLDNTGSMDGTKISTLRTAANDLVDILLPDNDLGAAEKVRIGLVPFTTTVRVDKPSWFEAATTERQEELAGSLYNGCAHMRPGNKGWNDHVPTNGEGNKLPYYDAEPNPDKAYDYGCNSKLKPLTNNRSALKTAIDAMSAEGHTSITLGAAWGWRVLSPQWQGLWGEADRPFAYDKNDHQKFLIILTDGEHVPLPSVDFLTKSQMDDRLADQCTAMKNEGITIYTIMFQAPASVRTMFQNCATDSSKFIESATNSALKNAFKRIAGEIRSVYLSR